MNARRIAACLLLWAACGEAPVPGPAGGDRPLPVLDVHPVPAATQVVVDGMDADPAWKRPTPLVVPLEGAGGPAQVSLKAVCDRERIYFQLVWKDGERSTGRYWRHLGRDRFERHVGEDGVGICFSPGLTADAFRAQGCALYCHDGRHFRPQDERGFADFWYWGAQQTASFPQARDLRLPFGKRQRLRGDSQPAGSDNLPNRSAEFEGPRFWPKRLVRGHARFLTPDNAQVVTADTLRNRLTLNPEGGREIPLEIVRARLGSRGDVTAVGRYHPGAGWVLEFARRFDTGHDDDLVLAPDPLVTYRFAVAIYDGTDGAAHACSGPLELHFVATP